MKKEETTNIDPELDISETLKIMTSMRKKLSKDTNAAAHIMALAGAYESVINKQRKAGRELEKANFMDLVMGSLARLEQAGLIKIKF